MRRALRGFFLVVLPVGALLIALLPSGGCAARGPQTWRLVTQDRGHLLVPPGIATASVPKATFSAAVPSWRVPCSPSGNAVLMQKRGKHVRVTVTREDLLKEPPGWLAEWTAFAEAQGCLQQGTGLEFARRILDSLPLDPPTAYRLLHSDSVAKGYIDLGMENRLQVVSPVIRLGADSGAPVIATATTAGDPNQLIVDIHDSDALLGVETSWYAFQVRPDHNGSRIVAASAERTIGGNTEPAAAPLINYFQFAPSAAFYRLFYKADLTNNSITEIVITAPTRA